MFLEAQVSRSNLESFYNLNTIQVQGIEGGRKEEWF